MYARERVWLHDTHGVHPTPAVPPAAWQGERGCIVGPFSSAECAREFLEAQRSRLRGAPGAAERVFAARSAYYVEMRR